MSARAGPVQSHERLVQRCAIEADHGSKNDKDGKGNEDAGVARSGHGSELTGHRLKGS